MGAEALRSEDLPQYTYEDYVHWEGRWELIQGIPYAMTPAPSIGHQVICSRINWQLRNLLQDCRRCEVLPPVDWPIADDTVVQPDVLVVCGDRKKMGVTRLEVTPVIVFEILSPSTSQKDRIVKYRLYEQAGVKYYCIVDPETKSAVVFSLHNQGEKYGAEEEFKEGKMFFDLGSCQMEFDFGNVFDI
jgi:Uma2 family endonuclease